MMHHWPPVSSSSCLDRAGLNRAGLNRREESFGDSIEALQTCCAQARDAACVGCYRIAHQLFQNALVFFDRARALNYGETDELYLWPNTWQLLQSRRQLDRCAALIYIDVAGVQNIPANALTLEAVERRARLDELPALIATAEEHGGRDASQRLRCEKGDLEMSVPVLESECHVLSHQALCAQITQFEQELQEAETTLRVTTGLGHAADQAFALQVQNLDQARTPVVETAKNSAAVQMYEARHQVEYLRLQLARLRLCLRQNNA